MDGVTNNFLSRPLTWRDPNPNRPHPGKQRILVER
jgi:hypothetical protein